MPQKLFGTEVKQIVNTFDSMHESPRHSSKGKSHPQNVLFIRDSETDKTSLGWKVRAGIVSGWELGRGEFTIMKN